MQHTKRAVLLKLHNIGIMQGRVQTTEVLIINGEMDEIDMPYLDSIFSAGLHVEDQVRRRE